MGSMTYARSQWDRVAAWVAVGLGALALLIGWLGVSNTGFVFEQLPYVVSGGIGGLFLLGLGAMLWLSADLRDEWRKLDSLEQALVAAAAADDALSERELVLDASREDSPRSLNGNGRERTATARAARSRRTELLEP